MSAVWEAVIGIEVHVQLRTERKLFCADRTSFGDDPNRHVCPVCLGLPGALPTVNAEAVTLAVRTALALGCEVNGLSVWARKNYFYPDLPKGYQITQFDAPLATGGSVTFEGAAGASTAAIRRIHMEEDAGKSLHDRLSGATAVDLNRAGTPLVEIVTEPDLRTPEDVRAFLTALKQILEYVEVSDCNMEEGSLRADANVSIRPLGSEGLGTKTEIKNVNSFSGIERAVALEIERQVGVLDSGGIVHSETLLWDDHRNVLRSMRSKEESHDYRYFPDPDLPPLVVSPSAIDALRASMPELPRARRRRFEVDYGLSGYDAEVLTQTRAAADYFEDVARRAPAAKLAANWVMGPVQALVKTRGGDGLRSTVAAEALGELIALVHDGTISESAAKQVLRTMAESGQAPGEIVKEQGLEQVRDGAAVTRWVDEVMEACPDEVSRYRAGEVKILGFLVGQVMRRSGGKADPRQVSDSLSARLASE